MSMKFFFIEEHVHAGRLLPIPGLTLGGRMGPFAISSELTHMQLCADVPVIKIRVDITIGASWNRRD